MSNDESGNALTLLRDAPPESYVEIRAAAGGLSPKEWPDERIQTVIKIAAPEAKSIAQASAFLYLCQKYQLDPIMRQVFFGEIKGVPSIITGRDTWLTLAGRQPSFKGMAQGVVYKGEKCTIKRDPKDPWKVSIDHDAGFESDEIVGSYCVVFDANRPPIIIRRFWSKYKHLQSKTSWIQNPDDMMENRSIAAALRRMYQFDGMLMTGEEGGKDDFSNAVSAQAAGVAGGQLEDLVKAAEAQNEINGITVNDDVFFPENVILSGKNEGLTWIEAREQDPQWLDKCAKRGWILSGGALDGLRAWVSGEPQNEPVSDDAAEPDQDDADQPSEGASEASRTEDDGGSNVSDLERIKIHAVGLVDQIRELKDLDPEELQGWADEVGILHHDGQVQGLTDLCDQLERVVVERGGSPQGTIV